MTDEEENPQISARAMGDPELEDLKALPADKRRALVRELALMSEESPAVAQAAQKLMQELDPWEES